MGDRTKILWADASWNPVAGCSKKPLSPGCQNCYARVMAHRMGGNGQHFEGLATAEEWTGDIGFYRNILVKPLQWTRPRNIFVSSMGDLFFENVPDNVIDEVFGVIAACAVHEHRNHRFLMLTKRPERLRQYINRCALKRWANYAADLMEDGDTYFDLVRQLKWPLENLWIGTSTENQEQFDKRVPEILRCPAAGRFVSVEPMLGKINFGYVVSVFGNLKRSFLDWVICGGESGPKARPVHPDWVRGLRDQCQRYSKYLDRPIPFIFKQWGAWKPVDWCSEATHAVRVSDGYLTKLNHEPCSASRSNLVPEYWQGIARFSKKDAGRELDGREHLDRPVF